MTDVALVLKKLARIEACVADLQLADLERLKDDVVVERFVLHTLQLAAQAVIDVAAHIVSDDRLGTPRSNAALFELLARHGWIDAAAAQALAQMARFRNVIVHDYDDLDLALIHHIATTRVVDLIHFVGVVRTRLTTSD